MSLKSRGWKLALPLVALTAVAVSMFAVAASASPKQAGTIRVAILSDCKGAFGSFYDQDIAGTIAAFSQYAGAKPKNNKKPSAGMTDGKVGSSTIKLVGIGCGDDTAALALKETKRLVEGLKADVLIGPLSGDESIAVAQYAKAHPKLTVIIGTAGAQDTTLKVRAKNVFRFNGDGAQWNAGLGKLALKAGLKNMALIADDYSFAWTSAAGFVVDYCGRGGKISKRVYPPLNETDYSSWVRQLPPPDEVDGYFWAVGGAGLIPSLKAFEQAYGPIKGKQFVGNGFWTVTGYEEIGNRAVGSVGGTFGVAGDLKGARPAAYYRIMGKWFKEIPPFGDNSKGQQGSSNFVYNYYNGTWGFLTALKQVDGDMSDGGIRLRQALARVVVPGAYGDIRLDKYRQAVQGQYNQKMISRGGKLTAVTVAYVPNVDATFGGVFDGTPSPGRTFPACKKYKLPWAGKERPVVNGIVK